MSISSNSVSAPALAGGAPTPSPVLSARRTRLPFAYGWVMVVMASLAMTATLPGRTHGLGLITRPLLRDLNLGEVFYSTLNFWAIILGAVFCLPVGRLLDRFGTRIVLTGVSLALGIVVVAMSGADNWLTLFLWLILVRGLGQGALSVVSMALVGKWFRRRLAIAMGVFSVFLGLGFTAAIPAMIAAVGDFGWRSAWAGLGWCLVLGMAPLSLLLVRSSPEACGLEVEAEVPTEAANAAADARLTEALASPAFWGFTLAASLYGLLSSAFTLFPQAILEEHGLAADFMDVMTIMAATGLMSNLVVGWLATRWPLGRLLALSMLLLAATLAAFPWIYTHGEVICYALGLGVSGGVITVIFFAFYGRAYGRANLGQIQGAAQVLSVFASALGPLLMATIRELTGSYDLMFYLCAPLAVLLGVWVLLVPIPRREASS